MNALDFTLCELVERIRKREISAEEVTVACFDAIEKKAELNNFITVCKDEAIFSARNIDGQISRGENTDRLLLGVPIAVKDNIAVGGARCTCASAALNDHIADGDSDVVKQLRAAGAIVIGKTNMDEFAMGSSTENSAFGAVKNALDISRVAGGSSGGSANCVAARQAFGALGSDTGGSVRQPAAFCGVVGLKPTYSRISGRGMLAFVPTLDQIGVFARNCDDAYAMLKATENNFSARKMPLDNNALNSDLRGRKLGVDRRFLNAEGLDPKVKREFERAIVCAEKNGAHIVEIDIPSFDAALDVYHIISSAEAFRLMTAPGCVPHIDIDRLGEEVRRRLVTGAYVLDGENYDKLYIKACKVRAVIQAQYAAAFGKCDCIISPTSPTAATPLGAKRDPHAKHSCDKYAAPASLAGLPAVSVPFGVADGLPVGIQIVCGHYDDAAALGIGKAIMTLS